MKTKSPMVEGAMVWRGERVGWLGIDNRLQSKSLSWEGIKWLVEMG